MLFARRKKIIGLRCGYVCVHCELGYHQMFRYLTEIIHTYVLTYARVLYVSDYVRDTWGSGTCNAIKLLYSFLIFIFSIQDRRRVSMKIFDTRYRSTRFFVS